MKLNCLHLRYDLEHPQVATDPLLETEGFFMFRASAKIWAISLEDSAIKNNFPSGKFIAAWYEGGVSFTPAHAGGGGLWHEQRV